ncbi:MAG: protein kinase, partial [Pseudomonadota bacterium]
MLSPDITADEAIQATGEVPARLFGGRYRAVSEIGRGSTGQLFLTETIKGESLAVVKTSNDVSMLRNEADVLSKIRHPDVVELRERHEDETPPFLLLNKVDGQDLETLLRERGGPLDEVTLGQLLVRLSDAVSVVHSEGFLHRDLKPGNILIRPDETPVLIDFGAASRLDRDDAARHWSFVTEGFAAPEQYFADQREGAWT